jgi:hypothetical protein
MQVRFLPESQYKKPDLGLAFYIVIPSKQTALFCLCVEVEKLLFVFCITDTINILFIIKSEVSVFILSMKNKLYVKTFFSVAFLVFYFISPSVSSANINISNCNELQNIGNTGLNGDYVLTGNIDCSGIANFSPIGTFTGTFDGQGYIISNLTINGGLWGDRIALFSYTNGAVIRNLSITNANIQGNSKMAVLVGEAVNTVITNVSVSSGVTMFGMGGDFTGGLVGYADNSLISYSSSNLPMNIPGSHVGGLVGSSNNGTIISKSYAVGTVTVGTGSGKTNGGGLVGTNNSSTIVDSYADNHIAGGIFWMNSVGGLVGVNSGATALIDRSYADNTFNINGSPQGLVGSQVDGATTTNSFWNTTTPNPDLFTSAGGVGKNNTEMQTQGTFIDGWDFTNVWIMSGYPVLRAGDVTAPGTPSNFTAVASGSDVSLQWINPADLDFVSVSIRRDTTRSPSSILAGNSILSGSTATSYDNDSIADATYYYSVIAVDTNGNYSLPARATVTVDTTPPSAPTGFTAVQSGSNINLSWTNPGSDFASATIRRSTSTYPTSVTDGLSVASGLTGTTRTDAGLADGVYYYSIFALDSFGNISARSEATVTLDTVVPVISISTPVTSFTNDSTPVFSFNSSKAGTITYGGSCSSATGSASIGLNNITLNALSDGQYSNCTILVTDNLANASILLSIPTFTVDTQAPVLVKISDVSSPSVLVNARFSFSSTEQGTYNISGCSNSGSSGVGVNTVGFSGLAAGVYNCTLSVSDNAGNISNILNLAPFTIIASPKRPIAAVVNAMSENGDPLDFSIDQVVEKEGRKYISLKLNANPSTVQGYAVDFDLSFSNSLGIMPYSSNVLIPVPDYQNINFVYLRYYSKNGNPTDTIQKSVIKNSDVVAGSEIKAIVSVPIKRNLQSGMRGDDVKFLQQFFNSNGFIVSVSGAGSPGRETDFYGKKLRSAVIAYQKENGITMTGSVGPITLGEILKDLNLN